MDTLSTQNQIAPSKERLPFCNVPGVTDLAGFMEYCQQHNLTPTQVTQDEILHRVSATLDLKTGIIKGWEISPNFPDGMMACLVAGEAVFLLPSLVMASAAMSLVEYFTKGEGHIDLGSGEAFVAIGFKDGKLSIQFEPHDKPIALKKLLMAALLSVLASDAGMPMEKIWKLFGANHD